MRFNIKVHWEENNITNIWSQNCYGLYELSMDWGYYVYDNFSYHILTVEYLEIIVTTQRDSIPYYDFTSSVTVSFTNVGLMKLTTSYIDQNSIWIFYKLNLYASLRAYQSTAFQSKWRVFFTQRNEAHLWGEKTRMNTTGVLSFRLWLWNCLVRLRYSYPVAVKWSARSWDT